MWMEFYALTRVCFVSPTLGYTSCLSQEIGDRQWLPERENKTPVTILLGLFEFIAATVLLNLNTVLKLKCILLSLLIVLKLKGKIKKIKFTKTA